MNILLTDISSLTLDQQELPLAPQADADSFAGLFSQQFPVAPGKETQDIDIKDFLDKIPTLSDASRSIPELSPGSSSDENLLPDPTSTPINTNLAVKAATELIERVGLPVLKLGSEAVTNALVDGKTGETLPAGGKSLPVNAALDIAQRGMSKNMTAPAAGVSDTLKGAPSELKPQVALSAAAPQSGKLETLSAAINAASETISPAADFVSVMNKSALTRESAQAISIPRPVDPESSQFIARDLLAEVKPVPETRQPGAAEVMRNVDFRTAVALPQSERSLGAAPQPSASVLAMVGEDQLDDTQRVLKGLRENLTMESVPAREKALDRTLMAGEKIPLPGPATARDMPGSAEYRNPDIMAQQSANLQQSTITPSASALQSVSVLPHVLTPGTQSSALPPHLETLTLPRNADATEWSNGLSERVNWMINQKQNTATIRLDPPFLGKLDVHVKIADDATTVSFLTQHAHTRELIETASVRLRDFLQESGYQNVNVDVSQRHDQQQRSNSTFNAEAEQQDESQQEQALEQRERDQASYFIGEGIVDTFA
ncbi:MAG: flagellar hook-length control protein FliK [Gammaproteobacteria bacterium]|nr:flagellar hook-length control protein FliK [Gammaproteobacteria bacterium]MDH3858401.1 flagellar hook-length control protein FliK [Gammaproteobacteria bacterium]